MSQASDVPLFWVVLSAIATSASAVVVGFQAWFTRQSVTASQRQAKLSSAMAVEATKARLDTRAPKVAVTRVGGVEWPPLEPSVTFGGTANHLDVGKTYHLPHDGGLSIRLRQRIRVSNRSETVVVVSTDMLVPISWKESEQPPREITIDAGDDVDLFFQVTRPVSEWVHIAEQREAGQTGDTMPATISVMDAPDDGVQDVWQLSFESTPLERVTDRDGMWAIGGEMNSWDGLFPRMAIYLSPSVRHYFVSKIRNEELPAPPALTSED